MFEAIAVVAGALVALVLVGGYILGRTFTAPEHVGNDRQYWS